MIPLIISLCSIISTALFGIITYRMRRKKGGLKNWQTGFVLINLTISSGIFLILLGCALGNYYSSLAMQGKAAKVSSMIQAYKKGLNHRDKTVEFVSQYNKELRKMQGLKRGWLWFPSWAYSDVINDMKCFEMPNSRSADPQ